VDEFGSKNCNDALKPGTSEATSAIALAAVDVCSAICFDNRSDKG
jgi:hypothetical protein